MPTPESPKPVLSVERAVFLVGAVQFVNVLDFMMVMPMGPDFARALSIPLSQIGLIGGSYTASAAVSGIIGTFFLDAFDRRKALALAMLGLSVGTVAGAFATGLYSLLAARVIAGAFGGPATSLAIAVIADVVPPARRGEAMGKVMGAFSIASVLGVPFGLELARQGSFRLPFIAVALLGLSITAAVVKALPPLTGHLTSATRTLGAGAPRGPMLDASMLLLLVSTTCLMIGNFMLIPNLSGYFQYNRGFPRVGMSVLYLVGGAVSFFVMRLSGVAVDRYGVTRVLAPATALFASVLFVVFVVPGVPIPTVLAFAAYMSSNAMRFVPVQTLSSRVPAPADRARFLSVQSAVQHIASSVGAFISSLALTTDAQRRLIGMPKLASATILLSLVVPFLCYVVERRVRARERAQAATPVAEVAVGEIAHG